MLLHLLADVYERFSTPAAALTSPTARVLLILQTWLAHAGVRLIIHLEGWHAVCAELRAYAVAVLIAATHVSTHSPTTDDVVLPVVQRVVHGDDATGWRPDDLERAGVEPAVLHVVPCSARSLEQRIIA
ncbi:MAG: hypothetical protein UY77_C0042G0006 [Candidatus Uhrbacteria bacterium GW2011_GWA2_53_10]|uniref:Uncharacterized protein n=1 Tax=Candidatus Uhrbacteria bacterium GW2011_GWA2_53_10 TaxID=1618980 RepID=A0A0G2AH44_9BACT|nr:MAG: hypothetical protein UY77_C0042G0006 [Candidatus Uhrbacteria bacterium GW2011_GWA2_53_10]